MHAMLYAPHILVQYYWVNCRRYRLYCCGSILPKIYRRIMVRVQTSGSSGDLRRVSPPSSPVSISGSSGGRKLNLLAFAGTLVYIGYLIGSIDTNKGGGVKLWGSTSRELNIDLDSPTIYSNDVSKFDGKSSQLRQRKQQTSANVTKDGITDLAVTQYLVEKIAATAKDNKAATKQYTVGPVINKDKGQVTTINLIGERHSGTNWITDHLLDCVSLVWRFRDFVLLQ